MTGGDLHIAEIAAPSGAAKLRYSRYLSEDGKRWIRHGPVSAYYEDGALRSDGSYFYGVESGAWRDFHPGNVGAAEERYEDGVDVGVWRFWNPEENEEPGVDFEQAVTFQTRESEG